MAPRLLPLVACVATALLVACSPPDPPPTTAPVIEPGPQARWYRGNLHTHTLWSDGNDLPEAVVERYRGNGFHFLAITDHDLVPAGEKWVATSRRPATIPDLPGPFAPERRRSGDVDEFRLKPLDELEAAFNAPGAFLLLRGEEISDAVGPVSVHVNALNLASTIQPARHDSVDRTIEADLAAVARQGEAEGRSVLAQLNHPNFTYSITAEHLMRLPGTAFFEVYNGHPLSNNPGDGLRPSTESLWDIALAWRLDVLGLPLLYATATDDSHHYQPGGDAPPGRGWIEVLAQDLSADALFDAMRRGRFYASTGVGLKRIVAADDRLEVEVEPEPGTHYTIEFIGTRRGFDPAATGAVSATGRPVYASHRYHGRIGTVFSRQKGARAVYRFAPDDLYVRARVIADRPHHDPSQPLQFAQAWVQPLVGPAGRQPSRPHLQPPGPPPASLHQGITRRFEELSTREARLLSSPRTPCSLDSLSDGQGIAWPAYPARGSVAFSGWIADPRSGRVPDSFAIVLDGERDYIVEDGPGRRRPDLAQHFGGPQLERAGFHSSFEVVDVAPGEYRIWLVGFRNGKPASCDSGKTLRIS
jgi:hypothetical protein